MPYVFIGIYTAGACSLLYTLFLNLHNLWIVAACILSLLVVGHGIYREVREL